VIEACPITLWMTFAFAPDAISRVSMRRRYPRATVLRQSLADTPRDRDFPDTLARVRDAGVVTMTELAEWTGLSRSRLYELLAQADDARD
jgi:hypothetical protein